MTNVQQTNVQEDHAFTPDWVSPPGDTIADALEEQSMSQSDFAQRTGFTKKHVHALLKGKATISSDAAERLSHVIGSTPGFWLRREASYRAALERQHVLVKAKKQADWLKELPHAWIKKQHGVHPVSHKGAQVLECLRFFGVASVEAWRDCYEKPLAAFRASSAFKKKPGAVAAWLREAKRQATRIEDCQPFDRDGFKTSLAKLRLLTLEPNPSVFVPMLVKTCAAHGVAVVFVPTPPGCPASGATQWLDAKKAMLVLSLRHRTNDHLWFTFFHEAGHLLLHGKKMLFLEGKSFEDLHGEQETEANRFATDKLIPRDASKRLMQLVDKKQLTEKQVRAFAKEVGIAPGIVVGRLQHEGWLAHHQLNKLKIRYEWTNKSF